MFFFWIDLFPYFSIYFGQARKNVIKIPTNGFLQLSIGDSGSVRRFLFDHHRGMTEVCYWSRAMLLNFLVVGKTQIFSADAAQRHQWWLTTVKRQKWQQTIRLDRFWKGVQTTKENRSPQVCWKSTCFFVVRETDECNFMTKKHFGWWSVVSFN